MRAGYPWILIASFGALSTKLGESNCGRGLAFGSIRKLEYIKANKTGKLQ